MSVPSSTATCAAFYRAQHADRALPAPAAPPPGVTAQELCTRDVITADEQMPASEAARRMRDEQVGALVVVQEPSRGRPIVTGIVTDRDVTTRLVAAGRDPHASCVGDIMTRELITARPQDTALDVLSVMQRRRVRRVPVVGAGSELIGIVTLDDLVAAVESQIQALAGAARAAQRREV